MEKFTPKSASGQSPATKELDSNLPHGVEEKSVGHTEVDLSKLRIGTKVKNKKYGIGRVTGFKPGRMLVAFETDQKVFMFPSAFEDGYLTIVE